MFELTAEQEGHTYKPRGWWVDDLHRDGDVLDVYIPVFQVKDLESAQRILSKLDLILEEEGVPRGD